MTILIPGRSSLHDLSRSSEKRSFIGGVHIGPTAAQFHHVQVFNPSGSGKIFWVTKIWVSSETSQVIVFEDVTVVLGTNAVGFDKFLGAPINLNLKRTTDAIAPSGPGSNNNQFIYIPANRSVPIEYTDPIMIGEDNGWQWATSVANTDLQTTAEWFET